MFSKIRTLVLGFVAAGAMFLDVGAKPAMAQYGPYPGDVSTWSGYAPANPWGGYAPGGYVYITPAQPNTSWSGYAPATAWRPYQPGVVAQPGAVVQQPRAIYQPGRVATRTYAPAQAPARAGVTRAPAARSFNPSTYREFGSGRNVFMHKPWLPGQP